MNQTSSITDVLSGNKPIGFEVKLETKSLIILGVIILIAGIGILTYKKIVS